MRLVKRSINADGSGYVTLCPEESEDMWHAFNLIRPHDILTAAAVRRVKDETSTGSTKSQRVQTNLAIAVKTLDFDPQVGQLHVAGKICKENRYVKIGQHHTLDLELDRNFTLEKVIDNADGDDGWDSVARSQLQEALDPNRGAYAVAVVMQEGLANICFLTSNQTVFKEPISRTIPGKRSGAGRSTIHDKGLQDFFKAVRESLLRHLLNLVESKGTSETFPILLASPGFTATGLLKHINEAASKRQSDTSTPEDRLLVDLVKRKAFIVVHSSSGTVNSLNEVLSSPEVKIRLKDTKYAKETVLMDNFFTLLRKDDGRAWYGPKEVEQAVEKGAVGKGGGVLFISNDLFRSSDVATRRRWVALKERVEDVWGGDVRILSGDHESGRRLEGLGGVAAILTFPIDDFDDLDGEEISDEG